MFEIRNVLIKLGLSEKETSVFLALVRRGTAAASAIATETGITRTHIYDIAESLKTRGFISEFEESGVRKFEAIEHAGLLAYVSRQQKELRMLEKQLTIMAHAFNSLRDGNQHKTRVRFLEGKEGMKNIYAEIRHDIKKIKKPIELLTIFSPEQLELAFPAWLENEEYIEVPRRMVKRGILFPSPITTRYLKKIRFSSALHHYRLWPMHTLSTNEKTIQHDVPVDTLCWFNKIAFIDLSGFPSGILIENQSMSSMFRMWFEMLWKYSDQITLAYN